MNPSSSKNRRRNFLLAAVVMVLALVVIAWPRGPKEPVYQGKKLTQWMEEVNEVGFGNQSEQLEAAMNAIGTNALPFLLKEFTRPISPGRTRLSRWFDRHPYFKIHLRDDEQRIDEAAIGLMLLGTNATPALPVVLRYLGDPYRNEHVWTICAFSGEGSFPHLTAALASTNLIVASNAALVMQGLAQLSGSSEPTISTAASNVLHKLRTNAPTAPPR